VEAFQQFVDSPDAQTSSSRRMLGEFTLTAYAVSKQSTGKTPQSPDFGITFSGTKARVSRTVAVDPKVIPIGTLIYIDGVGWRLAEDTGGAVKGNHIDVLMTSDAKALQFGVKRHIRVYTIADPPRR
jgi:3D (Asp-Asp-Asp) domain-containing protein